MKTFILAILTLTLWALPALVQCGTNQVDLDGKGLNHLSPSGREALRSGQQAQNSIGAEAGKKAMKDLEKQQKKNRDDMAGAWDSMNKGSGKPNPWRQPTSSNNKSSSGASKKSSGQKGKSWQVNH